LVSNLTKSNGSFDILGLILQIFPIDLGFWNFSQTNSVSKPPQLRRMAGTKNLILILLISFNKVQVLRGRNFGPRKYWTSLY